MYGGAITARETGFSHPPIIPYFTQPLPLSPPMMFDIFIEEVMVLVVGIMRVWEAEVQKTTILFD